MLEKILPYAVLWVRIFFGLHSFLSGSNFLLNGFWAPLPVVDHPTAGPFVSSMTEMGLFTVVKVIETATGICLLLNRFVPLALVAELSVSVTIFYMSVLVVHNDRSTYTGTRELVFNLFLLAAYSRYYLPMLSQKAIQQPIWKADNFSMALRNLSGRNSDVQADGELK